MLPGDRGDHGPIRQVVRDYIIDNLDVMEGRNLFGRPIERRCKYSVRTLALRFQLNDLTLRNLLVARGDISPMLAEKPPAILLVDAEAGHAAVAALRDSLTVEAAAKRLAANRQMMDWLILIGHLAPLHQGRGRSGRVSCRIGNPDVDTLLEHLHRIAPAMETVPATWAPMIQATKRARITMHVLLDLMLNGHLQSIGRESGSSGFFVDSP